MFQTFENVSRPLYTIIYVRSLITASKFRADLRARITDADVDVQDTYNQLIAEYGVNVCPQIGEIVPFDSIRSTFYAYAASLPARDDECPICLQGKVPKAIAVGCGHSYCEPCLRDLKDMDPTCVVCRQPFTDISRVF